MENNLQQWMSLFTGFGNQKMEEIGFLSFIVIMTISLFSSVLISYLYTVFYESRSTGSQVHKGFPLLGISVTGIFICIQFSLPLSLGLLGALSIVRFRTPVKEPEEVGFIMLVIAASICCATYNLFFLAILLFIAFIALLLLRYWRGLLKGRLSDGMLIITIPSVEYRVSNMRSGLIDLIESQLPKSRIESITENDDDSIISYNFQKLQKESLLTFHESLKRICPNATANFYFNRSGEI